MGSQDTSTGSVALQLEAIEEGRAFARPAGLRIVRVDGSDASAWLHDLVTTDVASLGPGRARRSLLLTPTGRIRADFMVGRDGEAHWLIQDAAQTHALDAALAIYVLSSDVRLTRVDEHAVWTLLGTATRHATARGGFTPSILGPGMDVMTSNLAGGPPWSPSEGLPTLDLVDEDALEAWRILRGDPRMGTDFEEGALPSEAGLDATIDATKGCFLGQESVAKIRNLGHPPTVLRHLRTEGAVLAGTPVGDGDADVGVVSSATACPDGGTVAIVRVEWSSRDADLRAPDGSRFLPVHLPVTTPERRPD